MKAAGAERRRFARERRRIACSVTWRGTTTRGWVRDWSANGLAVEVQVQARVGDPVEVELRVEEGATVQLTAQVVRVERSHPSARAVAPPRLGLQINIAPEEYFQLLMRDDLIAWKPIT